MDMSSPAPSFNSLPSSRKGRCVQSSLQCLSRLHQYAMFLFVGHLPPPPPPPHTHTSPTRPSFRKSRCVQSSMQCPLYTAHQFQDICPDTPFCFCLADIYHSNAPPPPNSPSPTVSIFRKRRLCHSHQSGFNLVSYFLDCNVLSAV